MSGQITERCRRYGRNSSTIWTYSKGPLRVQSVQEPRVRVILSQSNEVMYKHARPPHASQVSRLSDDERVANVTGVCYPPDINGKGGLVAYVVTSRNLIGCEVTERHVFELSLQSPSPMEDLNLRITFLRLVHCRTPWAEIRPSW